MLSLHTSVLRKNEYNYYLFIIFASREKNPIFETARRPIRGIGPHVRVLWVFIG